MTLDVDEAGYRKFVEAMKEFHIDTYDQWNIFFNTCGSGLLRGNKRARIRYIIPEKSEPKYTICVKSCDIGDQIEGGVARRREIEEVITKEQIDLILHNPAAYFKLAPESIKNELTDFRNDPF